MRVLVTKTVSIDWIGEAELKRNVTVELPPGADERDVTIALRELDRVAELAEKVCPGCFVPWEHRHVPGCPLGPDDQLEKLRAEAVEAGMRP